jgi:hypothetical protein
MERDLARGLGPGLGRLRALSARVDKAGEEPDEDRTDRGEGRRVAEEEEA